MKGGQSFTFEGGAGKHRGGQIILGDVRLG